MHFTLNITYFRDNGTLSSSMKNGVSFIHDFNNRNNVIYIKIKMFNVYGHAFLNNKANIKL